MAKFKGKDIAFIRGRGVVVFGDVVEGAVKIGMKLVLPDGEFAVTGIELATCIDDEGKHYTIGFATQQRQGRAGKFLGIVGRARRNL